MAAILRQPTSAPDVFRGQSPALRSEAPREFR